MNALLKFKFSIVSHKPQTTRHKILGILEGEGFQACFLDTPGLIDMPKDSLQKALRRESSGAIRDDADLVVYMVDVAEADPASVESTPIRAGTPVILVLNKCDRVVAEARILKLEAAYSAMLKPGKIFRISALKGAGVEELKTEILRAAAGESRVLRERAPLRPLGALLRRGDRARAGLRALSRRDSPRGGGGGGLVSRAARQARRGVRHAVRRARRPGRASSSGRAAATCHALTERAQAGSENFLGRPVHLEIWIKVRKDWRKDERSLKEFGYIS